MDFSLKITYYQFPKYDKEKYNLTRVPGIFKVFLKARDVNFNRMTVTTVYNSEDYASLITDTQTIMSKLTDNYLWFDIIGNNPVLDVMFPNHSISSPDYSGEVPCSEFEYVSNDADVWMTISYDDNTGVTYDNSAKFQSANIEYLKSFGSNSVYHSIQAMIKNDIQDIRRVRELVLEM